MLDYEGIFKMIKVYCFSGTGRTMKIAEYMANELETKIVPITCDMDLSEKNEIALVVFPVYCQNIPNIVADFLKELKTEKLAVIAAYGKFSYGNVMYEAKKLSSAQFIGGAYVPIGHTFLNENIDFDFSKLYPLVQRIKEPKEAFIPKGRKNPLASFLPEWRSRVGVKILKNEKCTFCGLCEKACPMNAMKGGKPNGKCIRCLKCVTVCTNSALEYRKRKILKMYLSQRRNETFKIYL